MEWCVVTVIILGNAICTVCALYLAVHLRSMRKRIEMLEATTESLEYRVDALLPSLY